jgi:hypothetical protein
MTGRITSVGWPEPALAAPSAGLGWPESLVRSTRSGESADTADGRVTPAGSEPPVRPDTADATGATPAPTPPSSAAPPPRATGIGRADIGPTVPIPRPAAPAPGFSEEPVIVTSAQHDVGGGAGANRVEHHDADPSETQLSGSADAHEDPAARGGTGEPAAAEEEPGADLPGSAPPPLGTISDCPLFRGRAVHAWSQWPIRRVGSARRPAPSTSRPRSPYAGVRFSWSTWTRRAMRPPRWGWTTPSTCRACTTS